MSEKGLDILSVKKADFIKPNGEKISVTPVRMGKLGEFKAAVLPIAGQIMAVIDNDGDELFSVLADNADAMLDSVSIATGIERAELEEWTPDQFLPLAVVVIKVNADFFVRTLLPMLLVMLKGMQERVAKAEQKAATSG